MAIYGLNLPTRKFDLKILSNRIYSLFFHEHFTIVIK